MTIDFNTNIDIDDLVKLSEDDNSLQESQTVMYRESFELEESFSEYGDLDVLMESVDNILEDCHDESEEEGFNENFSLSESDEEDLLMDDDDELLEEDCSEEEDQMHQESFDFNLDYYEPIRLSESDVRLFERDGNFLLMESDFEAVCFNYQGSKNGYEVLEAIAESHNIPVDNLVVYLSEGEVADPKVKVKKGKSSTGSKKNGVIKNLNAKISRLSQQIANLPPNSPSAKSKKSQRKRLRAQLVLHGGQD